MSRSWRFPRLPSDQAEAVPDHPRTYSLVGSPHLFIVTDDESGLTIGYADKIGGPLASRGPDLAGLAHLRTELVLRAGHLPSCGEGAEFPWDCTCDYGGFMDRMGRVLGEVEPQPAEPTLDSPREVRAFLRARRAALQAGATEPGPTSRAKSPPPDPYGPNGALGADDERADWYR